MRRKAFGCYSSPQFPIEYRHRVFCPSAFIRFVLLAEAFGGRGRRGPVCVMTDDSRSERAALSAIWPEARLLLCTFHVLQAVWRWLLDAKHGINQHVRQTCAWAKNESQI